MPTIGLADDHILLRKGLVSLVQNLGYSVLLEVDNGNELIQKLQSGIEPDLILMDINMPEMSGIEGVKRVRSKYSDIKIIMQTVFDDTEKYLPLLKRVLTVIF